MSSEKKESKYLQLQGGRVTIDQAKIEIKRWKDQFLELGDNAPYDFVQSFFIPMDDIKNLFENYKHLDPTGVRAYIGITNKDEKGCAPLRLLLVPAKKHKDFYNHNQADGDEPVADSSIYDFTMPCPDVCAEPNEINS